MVFLGKAARLLLPIMLLALAVTVSAFTLPSLQSKQLTTTRAVSQDSAPWGRVNTENDPLQVNRGYNKPNRRPGEGQRRVTNGTPDPSRVVDREEPRHREDNNSRAGTMSRPSRARPTMTKERPPPTDRNWERVDTENDPLQVNRGYNKPNRRPGEGQRRVTSGGTPDPGRMVEREEPQRRPSTAFPTTSTTTTNNAKRDRPPPSNDDRNWERVDTENDPLQVSRGYTNSHRPPTARSPPPRPKSIQRNSRNSPAVTSRRNPWGSPDGEMTDSFFVEPETTTTTRTTTTTPQKAPIRPASAGQVTRDDWKPVDVGNVDSFKPQSRAAPNHHHPLTGQRLDDNNNNNNNNSMEREEEHRDDDRYSPQQQQDRTSNAHRSASASSSSSSSMTTVTKKSTQMDPKEYDWTVQELLRGTNKERRQARLHDLEFNAELSKAALSHARDMARHDYFSHKGKSNKFVLADRIKTLTDYRYDSVAENMFWQAPENDPEYAIEGWMESTTGHKENLMSKDHSEVGIGYAYNPETEKHYYVQVYGNPLRTPPPPVGVEPTREVLFGVTNAARQEQQQQQGGQYIMLQPMMASPELDDAAQRHAEDIARAGSLDALTEIEKHVANVGMFRRLAANVAHREPFNDPYGAVDGWLETKSGRDYVFGQEMTHIGVGYAQDGDDHYYVQLYGSLDEAAAARRNNNNNNNNAGRQGPPPPQGPPMGYDAHRGPPQGQHNMGYNDRQGPPPSGQHNMGYDDRQGPPQGGYDDFRGPPGGYDEYRGPPQGAQQGGYNNNNNNNDMRDGRNPGGFNVPQAGEFGGPGDQQRRNSVSGQQRGRGYEGQPHNDRPDYRVVDIDTQSSFPKKNVQARAKRVMAQQSNHVTTGIPTADY